MQINANDVIILAREAVFKITSSAANDNKVGMIKYLIPRSCWSH